MIGGEHDRGKGPAGRPAISKAEKSRLRRRLTSMHRHRAALDLALAEFGDAEGAIDAATWDAAFTSPDPNDAKRVVTVTGCQSTLINNYVELLRASARLMNLVSGRRPGAETVIEACRDAGVLADEQAKLVQEIYRVEGRVEHRLSGCRPRRSSRECRVAPGRTPKAGRATRRLAHQPRHRPDHLSPRPGGHGRRLCDRPASWPSQVSLPGAARPACTSAQRTSRRQRVAIPASTSKRGVLGRSRTPRRTRSTPSRRYRCPRP